jgi:transposase-like protein
VLWWLAVGGVRALRLRAVELARLREQPIRKIGLDLGISESCLRRWMDQADVDQGVKEGPAEHDEQGSGITAPVY